MNAIPKKLLAFLLVFMMVLSMIPTTAFAAEPTSDGETTTITKTKGIEIVMLDKNGNETITLGYSNDDPQDDGTLIGESLDEAYIMGAMLGAEGPLTYKLTLQQDIEVSVMTAIPADKNVLIDLNGHKITSGYQEGSDSKHLYPFDVYGNLTITDSVGNGSISGRGIYVQDGATVTVESGAIYGIDANGGSALYQYGGDIVIKGGLVEQKAEGTSNFAINAAGGTVTVDGGKIAGNHGAIAAVGAAVEINNGELVCTGSADVTDNVLYCDGTSTITINGGTFIADKDIPSGGCCIYDANGGVTVNDGDFSNSSGGDVWGTTGTTIKGGTFENLIETQHVTVGSTITNGGKQYTMTENGLEEASSAVAKVNGVGYATLAEALTAASAMTGDVIVEIYDKVTLSSSLSGSFDSIKFVGMEDDAEIYLEVEGYITATGKKVAFEDLKLSKSEGGYITNAGFMNVAFGIYDVTEVTYTDCTFVNGAYASSGKVTYTGCTFYRSYDKYGLWAYGDVEIVVDDCIFDDYRGIKMYAEGAAKTVDLTVKNTDFSKLTGKPAIVLTYGESVTLEGNTYSDTGVFELDKDGAPNGTPVTSTDAITCVNDDGVCGVLVDGKIYTTVAQAAEVATEGSKVTLLHNSTETVELAEGVVLDKNGYAADGVTVKTPATLEGEGTEADPYLIATADDLWLFAKLANEGDTFAGKFVKLIADIDLEQEDWTPITKFNGTFDGDNHTIFNLWVEGAGNVGFFKQVADQTEHVTGTVKNVTFNNATIISEDGCAGLIADARLGARITNVKLTGEVTIQGYRGVGGIVGAGFPVITDCSVEAEGTIYATYWGVGGILGFASDSGAKVNNATVKGVGEGLTISSYLGGAGGVTGTPYGAATNGATISNVEISSSNNYYMAYVDAGGTVNGTVSVTDVAVKVNGDEIIGNDAIAAIDNAAYFSLQAAINAAEAGQTVKVLKNIELTEGLTVPAGKTLTLDLNGKTVSQTKAQTAGYQMLLNDGNLTIDDSIGGGKISYTDTVGGNFISNTITNRGTLTLKSGTVENLSSADVANVGFPYAIDTSIYGAASEVVVNIEGGTVTCANYSALRIFAQSTSEPITINISGGEINGRVEVQNPSNKTTDDYAYVGVLNITGGTINQHNSSMAIMIFGDSSTAAGLDVNISGGTVTGKVGYHSKFPVVNFDENVITGGTFNTDVSEFCALGYVCEANGDGTYGIKATTANVATWDELVAAIADKDIADIVLTANITADGRLVVDRDLHIDLNGKTLSLTQTNNRVWKAATLTIDGDGTINVSAIDGGNAFYVGGAESGAGTNGHLVLKNIEVFGENYNTGTNAAIFMLYGPASSMLDIEDCEINLKNNRGNGSVFYDTGTNNQCKINIVDSELNFDGTVRGSVCGDITIDNSTVVIENCDNGFNEATLTIKNGSNVTITDNTGRGITVNRNGYGIVIEDSNVILANNGEGDIRYKKSADITITNSNLSLSNVVVDSGMTATINGMAVENGATVKSVDGVVTINNPVAKIGDTYYETLADAVAAVPADGTATTITMLSDVELNGTVKIVAGKNITLDLNGKVIDGTEKVKIALMSYGDLILKDSSAEQTGAIKAGIGTAGNAVNICAGSFTMESGSIYSKNNALLVDEEAATITIKDGSITAEPNTYNSAAMYVSSAKETVINIEGGSLIGQNGLLLWNKNEVNISGGSIQGTAMTAVQGNGTWDETEINISGDAVITGKSTAIYHPQGGELNISGNAVITGDTGVVIKGGTVNISGGTINGIGEAKAYEPKSSGFNGTGDALYVEHYDSSTNSENYGTPVVNVTGGTFTSANASAVGNYANPNNNIEALTDYVSGGTFSSAVPEEICAEGYIPEDNGDGTYGVKVDPAYGKVAKIGDTYYEDLAEAIAAAQAGDTVTVTADIEQQDGIVIADKNITIDLNGKTFTVSDGASTNNRNFKIIGTSVVTIKNGTMIAKGNYSSGAYGTVRTEGAANVTLTNLKLYNYRGNGLNIKALGGTTVTMTDVEIYSQYGGGIEAAGGTIELTNVTVEQKGMYTAPYNSMAISVNGGGKVTVNSGTYTTECITAEEANNQGTSHGPWAAGVLNSGGTLIINGGTFSNDNFGENDLATAARGLILADTGAVIQINGGTFDALKGIVDIQNNLGDASKNPTGEIKGGTFSADPTNNYVKIAEGYKAELNEETGLYSVAELPAVAKINDVEYKSLAAAIAAAQDGDTVTMLADVALSESLSVASNITLDLAGKKLTAGKETVNLDVYGKMTIKDTVGGGVSTFRNHFVHSGAELIVESGTLQNIATVSAGFPINLSEANAVATINGGVVQAVNNSNYAVTVSATSTLNVNGGTIKSNWGCINSAGTVNIENGTFDVTGNVGGHCVYAYGGTVTIKNGDFNPYCVVGENATCYSVYVNGPANVTIENGNFAAGLNNSVIGMGANVNGNVDISGGTFAAPVAEEFCAEGYIPEENTDGTYTVKVDPAYGKVAKIGDTYYETLAEALAAANGGTVEVLCDIEESISELTDVTLVTNVAGGVTINNTYSSWCSITNVTIGKGVTLVTASALFDDAGVNVIEGTVHTTSTFYHAYNSKTTVQNGGKIISDGMIVNRYHDNADAGIYVYGDGDDTTVEVQSTDTIGTYSGTFYAKDAVVNADNHLWIDYLKNSSQEADTYSQSTPVFENSIVNVANELRLYKDATLTLMDSTVTAGKVQVRVAATPTVNITNSTIKATTVENLTGATLKAVLAADGTVSFLPAVAKVGDQTYATLAEAMAAANAGDTVILLAPIVVAAGETMELDLAGKILSYTSDVVGEDMITNYGTLTINDTVGGGKITYCNTDTTGNNVTVSTITNAPGGVLTVNGGTIENTSTDANAWTGKIFPFTIDNVTNATNGAAKTTINGGTIKSNYRSIRLFANSTTDENAVNITGGEMIGQVWLQAPNSKENKVTLTVSGGAFAPAGKDGSSIYVTTANATKPTFQVTGGNFATKIGTDNAALACNDGISGGTFTAAAKENTPAGLIRSGYEFTANDDGTYDVKVDPAYGKVAKIGDSYFETLADAVSAAQDGDTVTLLKDLVVDSETYTIPDGKTITLDMNGKKITATDNKAANVSYELFYIYGGLTVTGNGTIELTSTSNDTAWAKSSSIFHNRGGELTIENGTFEHLGGTGMAYVIDNSGNWFGEATTNIEGGTLTSTYTAIRNRMEQNTHGASGKAILNISGGTIDGTTSAIWAQAASISTVAPATGEINISGGEIGLINTARSNGAESMTTITGGSVAGFKGEVDELRVTGGTIQNVTIMDASNNQIEYVITDTGLYTAAVAKIGTTNYATLQAALDAAQDGDTVTVLTDIALDATVRNTKEITLDLNGKVISGVDNNTSDNYYLINNTGNLTIKDSATGGKITLKAMNDTGYNRSSVTVANNPGGKLVVESGIIEHTGGHTMAYAIDNMTNGKGTYAETVINGGTVESSYVGIRQFLNGVEAQNILTVNGGTVTGANTSIFFQDPSANCNSGKLYVGDAATLGNRIYVSGTAGTDWDVEFEVSAQALGTYGITTDEIPASVVVKEVNGFYIFGEIVAYHDDNDNRQLDDGELSFETVTEALAAAKSGEIVVMLTDAVVTDLMVKPGITLDLNGNVLTADFVVTFTSANIVDATEGEGLLKIAKDGVILQKSNAMIPVYNGEGYIFGTMVGNLLFQKKDENSAMITMLPVPSLTVTELFKDGAEDNGIKIVARLTWTAGEGEQETTKTQDIVVREDLVKTVFQSHKGGAAGNFGKAFRITITGIEGIEDLQVSLVLVSSTGSENYGSTKALT